ncbi:MAG: phosphoribosylglycinamide formyltransferase [candidate division Zixibacteria bacterium]
MARKVKVAVFISGSGTNLQSLIDSCTDANFPTEITLVISSKKKAFGLERARNHSISAVVLRKKDFGTEQEYADEMLKTLKKHHIEIICLAGYLKLIPSSIVRYFENRILNIHPALLPKFGGAGMYGMKVHEAVIAARESESGPTVHIVDDIFDHGRIFMQRKVPVLPDDTPEVLQKRVLAVEHELYPEALEKLAKEITSKE